MPINIEDLSSDVNIQNTLFLNVSNYGNLKHDELIDDLYKNLKTQFPELYLVITSSPLCTLYNKSNIENIIEKICRKYYKYPSNNIFESTDSINTSEDVKSLISYNINTFGNKQYPKLYKELMLELKKHYPKDNIIVSTNSLLLSNPNKYLLEVTKILDNTFSKYWK